MPGRSSKSEDPNLFAKSILDQIIAKHDPESLADDKAIRESGKNPAAVALGRLGGKKGGKARADKLSARRRKQIAKKAASVRWQNKKSLV
jgi:hypothetical protein